MVQEQSRGNVAGKAPIPVEVKSGKSYWWCACGLSKNQPFCDGSHKATSLVPLEFRPDQDRKVFFCACKQTGTAPLCDGTHKSL